MSQEEKSGSWLRYSHLGIQFCLTFGLIVWLGIWADGRLGWTPWLTIAGALFGMTAATYVLVRETTPRKPPPAPPSGRPPSDLL